MKNDELCGSVLQDLEDVRKVWPEGGGRRTAKLGASLMARQ